MGNLSYAVNERLRRVIKWSLVVLFFVALVSPFFVFSSWGADKLYSWSIEHDSPNGLYYSARLHCIMGTLSPERYEVAEEYLREFLELYGHHEKAGLATFYVAWSLEEQKRWGSARDEYEYFLDAFPDHDKAAAAEKALNRIEAFGHH